MFFECFWVMGIVKSEKELNEMAVQELARLTASFGEQPY